MKKPIIIINSFKMVHIPKDKKPIVICDIDLTFIQPVQNYTINNMLTTYFSTGLVKQTDSEGFTQLLERINLKEGKLIFLTARSSFSHGKTISDLKNAGLQNPQDFEIHYTGNEITKGHYIQKYNLLKGYDHHIFIDDNPMFLESALQIYPDMNCYLFKCK